MIHTYADIPAMLRPDRPHEIHTDQPFVPLYCGLSQGQRYQGLTGAIGLRVNGFRMPQIQYMPFENAVL